jgi:hypothetical protein
MNKTEILRFRVQTKRIEDREGDSERREGGRERERERESLTREKVAIDVLNRFVTVGETIDDIFQPLLFESTKKNKEEEEDEG